MRFVHIADERNAKAIRKSGLRLPKRRFSEMESATRKFGVFALPLVANFVLSHQWLHELKRSGYRSAVGVYFQIADDESVWAGKYNSPKEQITAAQAAATLGSEEILGIAQSGYSAFPPRLATQPIFYPVLNFAYAEQIARDWNTKDRASGYAGFVTKFKVDIEVVACYWGEGFQSEAWLTEIIQSIHRNIAM